MYKQRIYVRFLKFKCFESHLCSSLGWFCWWLSLIFLWWSWNFLGMSGDDIDKDKNTSLLEWNDFFWENQDTQCVYAIKIIIIRKLFCTILPPACFVLPTNVYVNGNVYLGNQHTVLLYKVGSLSWVISIWCVCGLYFGLPTETKQFTALHRMICCYY